MTKFRVRGFKGFDDKLQGEGGYQFAVGQTYSNEQGFYYATEAQRVYPYPGRYCIVEGEDFISKDGVCICGANQTIGSIAVAQTIKIIKEISRIEMAKLVSESVYSKEATGDYTMAVNTTDNTTVISKGLRSVAYNDGYRSLSIGIGDFVTIANLGSYSTAIAEGNNASIILGKGGICKITGDNGDVFMKGEASYITIEGKNCVVKLNKGGLIKGTLGTKIIVPKGKSDIDIYTINNHTLKENIVYSFYLEDHETERYVCIEYTGDVNSLHKRYMSGAANIHNAI